ncbi:multidrug efflux SMR transporter [Halobacillus shinanisalinarum]|uniref:Multidrug efflux SMR transporter n=1 Tax=Halobacillus shinanisalinarum TaxID=2932258 RepID=A0ABY4H2D0_9BACI|nr:multidrug efflux SMR transporter [Halobacillus shinanisalinarum]UOQ94290.1 multidrug efflux SMR transporter [Halobacillus shinanisalinarum]
MSWIVLIAAGLFEMFGVAMINQYHKSRSVTAIIAMLAGFALSFVCLSIAMKELPMGTAYAVWTGTGAAGGAILGMIYFDEPAEWRRLVCIGIIIAAAVGLKLIS